MGCSNSTETTAKNTSNPASRPMGKDWGYDPVISEGRFSDLYKLTEKLNAGAYGTVYRGLRASDNLQVAVKETLRTGPNWKSTEADLMREVKVLQKMRHPNVISVYDFFVDKEAKRCYVVLELMRGGDLFEAVVERKQKFNIAYNELQARGIMYVALKAIEYLHTHDIVHRDIKPENLLLVKDNKLPTIKLADFGFVEKEHLLKPGVCGTAGYMAPEIISERPYGKPCDMFSLGVVMYILLAGFPPYWEAQQTAAQESPNGVTTAIYNATVKGAWAFNGSDMWDHVTPELKDLISKLMHLDPRKRPNIKEALAHPWMVKADAEFSARPLDDTLKSLKRFNAKRKLMRGIRAVMAVNRFQNAIGSLTGKKK